MVPAEIENFTGSEKYVSALAHYAHWMTRCRLSAAQLDEAFVEQFLNRHLPRCDCHATALRTHGDLRAGLGHLLDLLREQGVIAELPMPTGPIADELCRYDAHMRDARGLAARTREGRLSIVGRLLLWKFAGRTIIVAELQPEELRDFIAQEMQRVSTTSHASTLAAALRAYFRYRSTCGDAVHGLIGVIASPARWSLASLPRALTAAEVQRLMAHCVQTRSHQRRLLAMVRLALDLGLRAGEIAWPAPQRIPFGPLTNFGYEKEVLLAVPIEIPADYAAQSFPVRLQAEWLVCEAVCIPESGSFALDLPVTALAQAVTQGEREQLPRVVGGGARQGRRQRAAAARLYRQQCRASPAAPRRRRHRGVHRPACALRGRRFLRRNVRRAPPFDPRGDSTRRQPADRGS